MQQGVSRQNLRLWGAAKMKISMAKEKPWRHNIELQYNIGIHIVSPEFEYMDSHGGPWEPEK